MRSNLDMNFKKYVGREYSEYNCFDLVKEFYLDVFNLKLKNYYEGDTPNSRGAQSLIISNKGDFVSIEEDQAKFGDIIVIELYGIECHLGVYIDKTHFLHSVKVTGSSLERIAKYKNMICGYYRHRELAHD